MNKEHYALRERIQEIERDLEAAKAQLEEAEAFLARQAEYSNRRIVVMVPSDSNPNKFYQVDPRGGEFACQCFDHLYRGGPKHSCKHVRKAQAMLSGHYT